MSKYEPLWQYIQNNNCECLTFAEIKNVLGFAIDHAFLAHKKDLKSYGYEVVKISIKEKHITFRKI